MMQLRLVISLALLAVGSAFLQPTLKARSTDFARAVAQHRDAAGSQLSMSTSVDGTGSNFKRNPVASYLRALEAAPLKTKIITSGVICGLGDILSQAFALGGLGPLRHAFDFQRMLVYGGIGGFYLAPLVHYWFATLEKITAKTNKDGVAAKPLATTNTFAAKLTKALKMVFLDQAIASPFLNGGFLFVFAAVSALASGHGFGSATGTGIHKVQTALWPTLLASWKIWPVANFINFFAVPVHLRVLFLNLVGVGWNIIMSTACN